MSSSSSGRYIVFNIGSKTTQNQWCSRIYVLNLVWKTFDEVQTLLTLLGNHDPNKISNNVKGGKRIMTKQDFLSLFFSYDRKGTKSPKSPAPQELEMPWKFFFSLRIFISNCSCPLKTMNPYHSSQFNINAKIQNVVLQYHHHHQTWFLIYIEKLKEKLRN